MERVARSDLTSTEVSHAMEAYHHPMRAVLGWMKRRLPQCCQGGEIRCSASKGAKGTRSTRRHFIYQYLEKSRCNHSYRIHAIRPTGEWSRLFQMLQGSRS